MTVDSVAIFEHDLRTAIASQHRCDCQWCEQVRVRQQWDTAIGWQLLDGQVQLAWLERHGLDDELGGALRDLLEHFADQGADIAGAALAIEAR